MKFSKQAQVSKVAKATTKTKKTAKAKLVAAQPRKPATPQVAPLSGMAPLGISPPKAKTTAAVVLPPAARTVRLKRSEVDWKAAGHKAWATRIANKAAKAARLAAVLA